MRKIFGLLLLSLLISGCNRKIVYKEKTFDLTEELYVKGISIEPGGKYSSSRWLYHVGTLFGKDIEFKIGDKIKIKGADDEKR